MNRDVEILAPAGSMECLRAAVAAGADAIYLGGTKFGARAYAQNLSEEDLVQAIEYVHIHGRKIYMTVNTLLKDRELNELYAYLLPYYKAGLDGVIVQDIGAVKFIGEYFPEMPVHASTQMTITNTLGADFLKRYGITRVVPARELSLKEIRDMKKQTGLEMECFVHGALCYCYSGQCLLSSMIGGRSGNRGQCAQPCRLPYQTEGKKPADLMSLKDLCTIDILPELIDAGIDSFKIEGRMKSPYYVAAIVKAYREALDKYWDDPEGYEFDQKLMDNLLKVSHRRYHTGFYFGKSGEQVYESSSYIRDYDIVGVVRDYNEETKVATIEQRNRLFEGDTVEVLTPVGDYYEIQMNDMKDEKDEKIDVANKAQMIFKVKIDKPVKVNDMLIKCKEANS